MFWNWAAAREESEAVTQGGSMLSQRNSKKQRGVQLEARTGGWGLVKGRG